MTRRPKVPVQLGVPSVTDCVAAAQACVCFNVRRAARSVTQVYDEALAPVKVSSGQFVILLSVRILGEATMQKLAETVALDRSALSRAVQPLMRRGLLKIEPGRDRRTKLIRLSESGMQLLAEGAPYWEQAQARMRGALGQDGFDGLLQTSRRSFEQLNR